MKAIQNELGDKARQDEDVEALRKAIEEAHLPENVYEKAKANCRNTPIPTIKWPNRV